MATTYRLSRHDGDWTSISGSALIVDSGTKNVVTVLGEKCTVVAVIYLAPGDAIMEVGEVREEA